MYAAEPSLYLLMVVHLLMKSKRDISKLSQP